MDIAHYSDPIDVEFEEINPQSHTDNDIADPYTDRSGSERLHKSNNILRQIDCLNMELSPFSLTFWDISQTSPRKKKDRIICSKIINALINDQGLMGVMFQKGYLPIRLLSRKSGISSRYIEAFEGYIVMASLVITGNYPDLQPYFDYVFDEA